MARNTNPLSQLTAPLANALRSLADLADHDDGGILPSIMRPLTAPLAKQFQIQPQPQRTPRGIHNQCPQQ